MSQREIGRIVESSNIVVDVSSSYASVFSDEFREMVVDELKRKGYQRKADNFDKCGEANAISECSNCGHPRSIPIGCGLRICPSCRIRANSMLVRKYEDIVSHIHRPKHMTLTVKNVSYFNKSLISELRDCFNKLVRRKGRKNNRKVGYKIRGGLYSIEVKKVDGTDGWNLHIHVLLSSSYIKQSKLSDEWYEITKESSLFSASPVVDIREVKGERGLQEVLTYVSKEGEIEEVEDLVRYEEVMHNTRQIQPFGTLYDKNPNEWSCSCKKCGCEDFDFLGVVRGVVIEFCRVDISYFAQVLTSLDTMEISSSSDSPNPPPNSSSDCKSQISTDKLDEFLSEVENTHDRTELEEKFTEEIMEYALQVGEVFEARPNFVKKV